MTRYQAVLRRAASAAILDLMDPTARGAGRLLDRHQARRDAGLPTVSILVGASATAQEVWRRWLEATGRAGVDSNQRSAAAVAREWIAALMMGRDVLRDIVELSRSNGAGAMPRGRDSAEVVAELRRATEAAREAWVECAVAEGVATGAAVIGRVLAAQPATPGQAGPASGGSLSAQCERALDQGREPGWARLLRELAALVPASELPGVLACGLGPHETGAHSDALLVALELTELAPSIPVAVALSRDAAETSSLVAAVLGRGAPAERAPPAPATVRTVAALREGVVDLRPGSVAQAPPPADPYHTAHRAARLRAILGDGPQLAAVMRSLDRAAKEQRAARADPDDRAKDQRARSAAEQLLFDALEAAPETRGLFALNGRLDFRFGPAAIEVDLLCRSLGLAIEIDGYHHFRDPEAYRRDRRKDLALQTHGLWVVRFLADDVIIALDRVLGTIVSAVAQRRKNPASMP